MYSLYTILTVPVEILKIATNKKLRKNHALEHATINVIEERFGPTNLAGLARVDGFYIKGFVDPFLLEEAARVALFRLKNGEKELAVHKRCGTTMAMVNFVSAVAFLLLLFVTGYLTVLNIVIALALSYILGPLFGPWVQRKLTTFADVTDMEIVGVEYGGRGIKMWGLPFFYIPTDFFVRTVERKDLGRVRF
ncbi:MAG: DUF6391 domain-containing protein [Synergistetes bacterium]|nr:DUF6391 domain-containing protein [Synergistota bacterium]